MSVLVVVAGLALLALLHEVGHAVAAQLTGMHITSFSVGLGPSIRQVRWGETIVHVGIIPFGGYVQVRELTPGAAPDDRFTSRGVSSRLLCIAAGPLTNYAVAVVLTIALAVGWGIPTGRVLGLEVTSVQASAAALGLSPGDVITRLDGREVRGLGDLKRGLRKAGGGDVTLTLNRGGSEREMAARPVKKGRWGFGARYVPRLERKNVSVMGAVAHGLFAPLKQVAVLVGNATQMFVPGSQVKAVSPVGVVDRVAKSGAWDVPRVLSFAAMLSIVVAVFNLLPWPGLDGGRLLIEGVEMALRRPLRPRTAMRIQIAGILVLGVIWSIVILRDLASLTR